MAIMYSFLALTSLSKIISNMLVRSKTKSKKIVYNSQTINPYASLTYLRGIYLQWIFKIVQSDPQGSTLCPVIFIIFINNVLYLYNYGDVATFFISSNDINSLKDTLKSNFFILVEWLKDNQMQGNPDEFQAMCIGKKQKENKDEGFNQIIIWCYQICRTEI